MPADNVINILKMKIILYLDNYNRDIKSSIVLRIQQTVGDFKMFFMYMRFVQ